MTDSTMIIETAVAITFKKRLEKNTQKVNETINAQL